MIVTRVKALLNFIITASILSGRHQEQQAAAESSSAARCAHHLLEHPTIILMDTSLILLK